MPSLSLSLCLHISLSLFLAHFALFPPLSLSISLCPFLPPSQTHTHTQTLTHTHTLTQSQKIQNTHSLVFLNLLISLKQSIKFFVLSLSLALSLSLPPSWSKITIFQLVMNHKLKLSRGEICVANFKPPGNGASHSKYLESSEITWNNLQPKSRPTRRKLKLNFWILKTPKDLQFPVISCLRWSADFLPVVVPGEVVVATFWYGPFQCSQLLRSAFVLSNVF